MIAPTQIKEIGRNTRRYVRKKPYLERGIRVLNGRCKVCGLLYPKSIRYIKKQDFDTHKSYIHKSIFYVKCINHGNTIINKLNGNWVMEENKIIQIDKYNVKNDKDNI